MYAPIAADRRRELGAAATSLVAAGLETAPAAKPAPIPRDRLMLLATGLAGSLLIGLSGQLVGPNIGVIAAAIGATGGAASWLSTAYIMALLAGIVVSVALIPALGVRRHMMASALLFAFAALGCALEPSLPAMVGLRAVQGFAAGAFGPIAFVAVFMTGGPRLPLGLALLAFVLLLPASFGPAAAGFLAANFGWETLFLAQASIGGLLLAAAVRWMPRSPLSRTALDRDWTAVLLLGVALAATVLVLGQGTRHDWFESDLIVWSTATAVAAWVGFAINVRQSPRPIIDVGLLARPAFIRPIALYLIFRAGLGATAFLVPQFLVLVHGYQPLDVAELFFWPAIAQLTAFPLVWWLLQRIDGRPVIAAGLLSLGLALLLIAAGSLTAGELRLVLALTGAAQIMFLVPNLIAGAGPLKPADGPTASLVFNALTIGGTTLGVALATEAIGGGGAVASASLAGAFQLTAALLILSAAGVLLFVRQPPLRGASAPAAAAAHSRPIG